MNCSLCGQPLSRIHLAPCQCELHVKIRELEAERERWVASVEAANRAQKAYRDEKARAEKAEASLEHQEVLWIEREHVLLKGTEALQARVAELERWPAHHTVVHENGEVCDDVEDCLAREREDYAHEDWGQDEGGEAFCHDCNRVVPMSSVPKRLAREREELR